MRWKELSVEPEPPSWTRLDEIVEQLDLSDLIEWQAALPQMLPWHFVVLTGAIFEQKRVLTPEFSIAALRCLSSCGDAVQLLCAIIKHTRPFSFEFSNEVRGVPLWAFKNDHEMAVLCLVQYLTERIEEAEGTRRDHGRAEGSGADGG